MQADIEEEVMKKERDLDRGGHSLANPNEGILAPVLSSKNRMSLDIFR